jgi:hypothetical protein
VNVTASGPFVNTLTVPEASGSTFALLSTAGPSWNSNADNNVGDVFKEPTHTSSENDNLVFTSGSIDFKIDSSTAITLNRIDLDPGDAGGDDVELESSLGIVTFPNLVGGETLSLSGSGTFDLEVGTFSTVFLSGTYTSSFTTIPCAVTVIIGGAPVPSEPAEITSLEQSGSDFTLRFTGETGAAGSWIVNGSTNLQTFSESLLTVNSLSETTTSNYTAIVVPASIPAPDALYLRIEK